MYLFLQKLKPVLFAILFLGGALCAVVWLTFTATTMGNALSARIQTVANKNAFEMQYKDLITIVDETQDERERLESYVLRDETDTINLLSQLDEIAKKQGAELATSQLNRVKGTGSYDQLSIGYAIEGSEAAVSRMIEMFETLPYHGHITSLSYARSINELTGQTEVKASISLQISILKHD